MQVETPFLFQWSSVAVCRPADPAYTNGSSQRTPASFDLLRKIELWSEVLRDFRGEWNNRLRASLQIQTANFSVLVINNFLSAGEKRIAGKKVARKNGFLIVACHRITHPVVFTSLQISQPESTFE